MPALLILQPSLPVNGIHGFLLTMPGVLQHGGRQAGVSDAPHVNCSHSVLGKAGKRCDVVGLGNIASCALQGDDHPALSIMLWTTALPGYNIWAGLQMRACSRKKSVLT